jgi:hypothetical protein
MKLRNAANSAWITLFQLDGEWTNIAFENGTAAAPSIYFKDSGTDTGLFSGGTDQVNITTGGTERVEWGTSEVVFNDNGANYDFRIEGDTNANLFFVDASADAVGIGTTSPGDLLTLNSAGYPLATFNDSGTFRGQIGYTFDYGYFHVTSASTLGFRANGSERARIDSSGRLLVGTSSNSVGSTIVCQGNSGSSTAEAVVRLNRGTAVPTSGQTLGAIVFGQSGSNDGAYILGEADAAWSASNDYPTRLVFSTTADGASSPTERMRISNNGRVNIGNTSTNPVGDNATGFYLLNGSTYLGAGSETVLFVNRKTNDGALISLQQDATEEGSISVSGTTVSYNGAHLSRWSQLPGGIERKEILRGTVLSNIDEMCAWGEEDNEQLNRMKVSDVEGDPNVSGVFQAWDDDDDTYTDDFYCAMTGDFIIRIAEGVTVQRGDLLMSAGDGTAKPQDDDIIRSKTIAKVTSTHVTCTYDDGSYCVPCVLMAC